MTLTSSVRAAAMGAFLFLAVGSQAQTIVNTETLLAQVDRLLQELAIYSRFEGS